MHMVWINAVAGRMRINYRYSNTIVYNNFPVPPLPDQIKEQLREYQINGVSGVFG
jgi:hypothetical protein